MGVYNPNMEMPRNCTECIEFKDDCDHYWDYYCTHESRPNDCPLIEIVKCKDCKHKIQALSTEQGATGCELIRGTFYEDFFCKEGERRADEHNT